ncbi:EamA family transporter [Aeromonas veronii]|uniref:EamA family transporter n=1 Tax=Aeromonas veronii TaxID=654 RepID=UPI001932D6EA|nr:DMT family transporter [Aeromonas veronii]MBM0418427.1 EamA family transporter [Aeromonas veronii]MBW3790726.1 EamA family transporter [Aeromonas veronii]
MLLTPIAREPFPMSTTVFFAVLLAALLHASWNALVKIGEERLVGVSLVAIFSGLIAAVALLPMGLPSAAELPWLGLSVLLHIGYCLFLSHAYNQGDFGQIYPLARGSAPLLAMALSALLLGDYPGYGGIIGACVLIMGVLLMAWRGGQQRLASKAVRAALITAMFTATYTLSDGAGARAGGEPVRYTLWLFACTGLAMLLVLLVHQKRNAWRQIRQYALVGATGGAMSLLAYGIVIWAMTQAPIGVVAALRESSVLFAMLLSVWLLKEPLGRMRLTAAAIITGGVLLTRLGG